MTISIRDNAKLSAEDISSALFKLDDYSQIKVKLNKELNFWYLSRTEMTQSKARNEDEEHDGINCSYWTDLGSIGLHFTDVHIALDAKRQIKSAQEDCRENGMSRIWSAI